MGVFVSTIIPTINRPTLTRAVNSVLDQSFGFADFEVIVANDSGRPLPVMDWQHCERVRVIDTNSRERSVARNAGASIARGKYLHFLDDDDYLLPGAMDTFWALDQVSDVIWLYGSYQTVDNGGYIVDEFHPGITGNIFAILVAGESIPLQASLIEAEAFFQAGAFDPTITGVEDRDVGRRLAMIGNVAFTDNLVAQIRIGEQGSSTDWSRIAEDDRLCREKILSELNAISRLRASTISSYWYGRVTRAYIASAVWNLKHRNILTSISRIIAALLFLGRNPVHQDFWKGIKHKFI
jgi:glycosyltransferase involved in cell wall biosynthesis